MEKIFLAKEARQMADNSSCQLKRVFKEIESAAKENKTHIVWSVYNMSNKAKGILGRTLQEAGYYVKVAWEHYPEDGFTDEFETFECEGIEEFLISW